MHACNIPHLVHKYSAAVPWYNCSTMLALIDCVLIGIGHVLNPRFDTAFTTVMWDPPQTAGVLSNLSYHLIVTNMNTGVVIINTTTTDTSYSLGSTQFCLDYRVYVVAFSSQYRGGSTIIEERTPGSEYIQDMT